MITEAIRNYEVSIWTLQDEFLTVLKWSNLEHKGEIENPKLTLDVDGTRNFTFSIPMYLYQNGKLVENPGWYNTKNGNIAVDMRKVKVIFNKGIVDTENVDWKGIFKKVYMPKGYRGNVDLFNRPFVEASTFTNAGYANFSNSYSTVYAQSYTYTLGSQDYDIIITPVTTNGQVYNTAALQTYLNLITANVTSPEECLKKDAIGIISNAYTFQRQILAILPHNNIKSTAWCKELEQVLAEWDTIRAANNWFGRTVIKPNDITIDSPRYYYYSQYLRSINTFEFLITKVNEKHEGDILTCEVTCEGLAFHELGKRGYIHALSMADFELQYRNWQEKGYWISENGTHIQSQPIQNVQFWCDRIGLEPDPFVKRNRDSMQWYYAIEINNDSFYDNLERSSSIVYEEPFAKSWKLQEDGNGISHLVPESYEYMKEKERSVEISESNLYNITQTIAEKFEIYCKYEYIYDDNYRIIGRVVIFFNNFLHDTDIMSLTYPYSSKSITREMDSTDITTKLFVRPAEDYSTLMGDMNITYCEANKTQENYILNFNYLKETGNLTDEQYEAIEKFETDMYQINSDLYVYENKIKYYTTKKTELEAKKTFYENSIKLDKEQMEYNKDYVRQITASDGTEDRYVDSHNELNPEYVIITHDRQGTYCINLSDKKKGIRADSVNIYRYYDKANHTFPTYIPNTNPQIVNKVSGFSFEYEYGNPIRIYGVQPLETSSAVYLTYVYEPILYYTAVAQTWEEKLGRDKDLLGEIETELDNVSPEGVIQLLDYVTSEYNDLILIKKNKIKKFENLMGPALREGYWQPEDYQDYGQLYEGEQTLPTTYSQSDQYTDTKTGFLVFWDNKLFDEEQDICYYRSINSYKVQYPMIDLSTITIPNDFLGYSFVFNNNYYRDLTVSEQNDVRFVRTFSIGSEAVLGFAKKANNNIIPVLILTGAKDMTDEQLEFMCDANRGRPRLAKVERVNNNSNTSVSISQTGLITLSSSNWTPTEGYTAVYPRIKFSSLMLKTNTSDLFIRYNNALLKEYEDYYIRNRHIADRTYAPEYLITIKPALFYNTKTHDVGSYNHNIHINYILSNASTAIYLDAIKVSNENAVPKVSYTIDPNILDKRVLSTLQNRLNWLVMINDVQLKFNNVFGYISHMELDLDFPDKDSIEIKNYKTKFEDLFSTIVASSEAMKKNEGLLSSLAGGTYALSEDGLNQSLEQNQTIFQSQFDNYFNSSEAVQKYLASLFAEAGNLLSDANSVLTQNQTLSIENSFVLSGFANTIQESLVPHLYRSATPPENFNKGDVWIETDQNGQELARYIATADSSSSSSDPDHPENIYGWVKTYNGSLAQITGAAINVDADAGDIEIMAQHNVDIAANEDVNIHGDKTVNITGTDINIISQDFGDGDTRNSSNGIWVVAQEYNSSAQGMVVQSQVSIEPALVKVVSGAIELATGSLDNNYELTSVSGIKLNPTDGIWMGSSNKISLFASDNNGSTANVEISPSHIFFGMNNTGNGNTTAAELTEKHIIFAAGNTIGNLDGDNENITISNNTAGVKITKDSMGLAVGNDTARSVILMSSNGVEIGTAGNNNGTATSPITNGSYVKISGAGVFIGAKGKLTVTTDNFKVNPVATNTTALFYVGTGGETTNDKYIKYSATNGLEIRGKITATSFTLDGTISGLSYSDIADAPDPSEYTTDGLSYSTWNSKKYVSLTSTVNGGASNGILIGVSESSNVTQHLIVPYSASSTKTVVDISKEGIYFNHYNSAPTANSVANNYIHMDVNGIDVKGKRIKINDKEVWGRDDIIISASDTYNSFSHPDHDWVWIKPASSTTTTHTASINNYNDLQTLARTDSYYYNNPLEMTCIGGSSLGQRISVQIKYTATFYSNVNYSAERWAVLKVWLSNTTSSQNAAISESNQITFPNYGRSGEYSWTTTVTTSIFNWNATSTTNMPLYAWFYFSRYSNNLVSSITLTSLKVEATAYGVNGAQTLCTVYYFP